MQPDDNESLNSSRSSLQQPPSAIFKGVVLTKQLSTQSQPVNNPIYTGVLANMNNNQRQISNIESGSASNLNQITPTKSNMNGPTVEFRNSVRC